MSRDKKETPTVQHGIFVCSFGDFSGRRHVALPSKIISMLSDHNPSIWFGFVLGQRMNLELVLLIKIVRSRQYRLPRINTHSSPQRIIQI
jgi:hypothetical protein